MSLVMPEVLVIDMIWKKYNTFQFKILQFRLVSVSAESYGQILSFSFGTGPKPKRWFRSYTNKYSHFNISNPEQMDRVVGCQKGTLLQQLSVVKRSTLNGI